MSYWAQKEPKSFLEAFSSFSNLILKSNLGTQLKSLFSHFSYEISISEIFIRNYSIIFLSKGFLNYLSKSSRKSKKEKKNFQKEALISSLVITFAKNTS